MSLNKLFLMLKHLHGQHDQQSHGRGKRGKSLPSKPGPDGIQVTDRNWDIFKNDDQKGWLEKSGRTIIAFDGKYHHIVLMDNDKNVLGIAKAFQHGQKIDPEGQGWWTLTNSETSEQKKGYGTEMYLDFLKYIYPGKLKSEFQTSDSAKALHASLKRRSDIEILPDGSIRYKP